MSIHAHHPSFAMRQRLLPVSTMATAALVATLLATSPVFGQAETPSAGRPAISAAPPAAISDQKLKAAAAAITHVQNIRQSYQEQLAEAPEGDRDRIASQANGEMVKAITDQGLSIDEYNSILQAAQSDPKIKGRLIEQLPQSGGTPGP